MISKYFLITKAHCLPTTCPRPCISKSLVLWVHFFCKKVLNIKVTSAVETFVMPKWESRGGSFGSVTIETIALKI
jgi:hypothetical protein